MIIDTDVCLLTVDYQTNPKSAKKIKSNLDARFSDLGGNALSKDKKGKPKQDDSSTQQDLASAGMGADSGYEPYVFYEFEIA